MTMVAFCTLFPLALTDQTPSSALIFPIMTCRKRAVEWGPIFSGIAEIFADSAKNKHCDSAFFQGNHPNVVMLKYSLRFGLEIL